MPLCRLSARLRRYLDQRLFRTPFAQESAKRYAQEQRPAFGDLDQRIIEKHRNKLQRAGVLLDLGSGPGDFARRVNTEFPRLRCITIEPSPGFASHIRAMGEHLPLANDCADFAICLSSLRHMADRGAALRELRRVCAPEATVLIVELDPEATRENARRHARSLGSVLFRTVFQSLVVRTAPTLHEMKKLAEQAGFRIVRTAADPVQPVYHLELT